MRLCAGLSSQDSIHPQSLQSLAPPRAVTHTRSSTYIVTQPPTRCECLTQQHAAVSSDGRLCCSAGRPVSFLSLVVCGCCWGFMGVRRVFKTLQTSGREHLLDLEIVVASERTARGAAAICCLLRLLARPETSSNNAESRRNARPLAVLSLVPAPRHVSRSGSSADCQGLTKRV